MVSSRSGLIVAGHARYTAARILDVAEVPVDGQDYESDQDEMAVLIADNQIAELASMDKDMLGELLSEMNAADYDMGDMGFDDKFFEKLFEDETPEMEDPDMEIQPYEHYDYVLVLATNIQDWEALCEALEIRRVVSARLKSGNKKIGLGRCIRADRLLEKLNVSNHSTESKKNA